MGANIAINSRVATVDKTRDTTIIVEVDRENTTLTEEGIHNTQNIVMNNIRAYATGNFKLVQSYSEIANAFVIDVNSNDVEAIKNVPGVKSVTLNEIHWESVTPEAIDDGAVSTREIKTYGGSENTSATTMKKPEDTNDGEGTLIAILDNEFYLKAATENSEAWSHETFTALDTKTVKVRTTDRPDGYLNTIAWKAFPNARNNSKGTEGSLYFNSKVPFYFDYGGEKTYYGQNYSQDFDVVSNITYHGSHVASIAAGHAPTYEGIAPKAQLVCMKVFTNYKATGIDAQLGFSASSGAYDVPILNALEDCIKLKVDGINMSLGSNLDDFDGDSITLKILQNLSASGILSSISAGNSGKTSYSSTGGYANWTTEMVETGILSSYANNASTTTVASGQTERIFYSNAFKFNGINIAYEDQIVNRENYDDDYKTEYRMADLLEGDPTKTLSFVYVPGFGSSNDYTDLNVRGKVAIVNRGSTTFADKYQTAKSKGAIGLVIINNDPTANDFNFRCSFGDDFRPSMPCALVLYKDKQTFEDAKEAEFNIIKDEIDVNPNAYTVSTFSSDGATYDLDLKPDITAPGDNIRGAVPPQKKEDREERPLSTYEFLSGTSMSAPNYAGAQSVVLSKVTGNGNVNDAKQQKAIKAYRATVDMRLMSTAVPMYDTKNSPETDELTITSPRRQGAGMANLEGAYNTDVYLEGKDLAGNPIGKSKIALRNNEDINKGDIKLSFLAHNEGNETRSYAATISVMRPAVAMANDIVTGDYNMRGEVESISKFPGYVYWDVDGVGDLAHNKRYVADGTFEYKDVFKVTRDISYYATEEDLINKNATIITKGNYYNAGTSEVADWQPLPGYAYQSTQDTLIATVSMGMVTVNPGDNDITLNTYSLSNEAKAEIAQYFEYGCYIEGYVTLEAQGDYPDLSMPYLGFYGGEGKDYGSAPVVEPFSFEKNVTTVYPSDLVNDIAVSLLGKDKADMGSMWLAGYVEPGQKVDTDKVLYNNDNFKNYTGFYELGTDYEGNYYDNPSENLNVGAAYATNTMIVQQFILRSVKDNYFTITNKQTGEIVYKSVLEDMIYGDYMGTYPLYKSHINDSYLGAGIVSARAYAIIPLYDTTTGISFPSGDYEIEFNYLLAGTLQTVSKAYTLHVDSDAPEVSSIEKVGDNVRVSIKENNLAYVSVGKYTYDFQDNGDGTAYVEFPYAAQDPETGLHGLVDHLEDNYNGYLGSGRLFIKLVDKAHGTMGVIARFEEDANFNPDMNSYTMVEHRDLTYAHDFEFDGLDYQVVYYNSVLDTNTPVELDGYVIFSRNGIVYEDYDEVISSCGGNFTATSVILASVSLAAIATLLIVRSKKRKQLGGNL